MRPLSNPLLKLLLKLRRKPFFSVCCIVMLILMTDIVVYKTGGTEFAFTHIMYIPIIVSAFVFGMRGSLLTSIIAGITLGPAMPMNTAGGIMQEPRSWLLRTVFFIVMGLVIAYLFQRIKTEHQKLIKKSYEHYLTGYPNLNKLRLDCDEIISKGIPFSLLVFKITNLDYINKYVDYIVEEKIVFNVLEILTNHFDKINIYCIAKSQFAVIIRECSIDNACCKSKEFLHNFREPVLIDGLPVDLTLRGGIVNHPLHGTESDDLLKKLWRSLDQERIDEEDISIYENRTAQKNKENYEVMISLYDAIKNNEFSIVYQPKINLKRNEVIGLEALLRWNNGTRGYINPEEFIQLAEYTGYINEITKWVVENVIDQLLAWKSEDLITKVAINISSKDLKDDSIIDYIKEQLECKKIEPSALEFELTERTIVDNENKVGHLLGDLSNLGLKISLDDFGTGHNSLIHLVKLPIDYVKLDKFFIHNIEDINNKPLIEGVIKTVHTLGMEVIAEGVENEDQVKILKAMGCDNIQGYYFSKPLQPDAIKEFISAFKNI
ncbi:EAL domain-containing protein [Sinanaerobacter chloroacetimidivorans]|jgi:EAL domain-containing protein (putative c-di-GMP-specific phosphodiesterase class I)/GGDEF domain-containing protein|uniref:EAL domain-containing protein n=1 Tax=Sinanaerobacter chloroacetimidivorans TaxID=2818044 RepID=A0A8J7W3T8_9FIRM|nr:EAL domain-containing protein [Sinanaerobacter chloroacetimidivorans]MBR0599871.1 EAL domain-containing protein [Sinanaerobacter chloroacetimidivorans]